MCEQNGITDSFLLSEESIENVEQGISVRYDTPGDNNDASTEE